MECEKLQKEHTNDTDLEVIARATKENFLLLSRCLFWWHPLFDGGEGCKRKRKGSRGRKAREKGESIPHFLKGAIKSQEDSTRVCHTPPPAAATSALDEVVQCPNFYPFPHNFRLGSTAHHYQSVCFFIPYLSFYS
jgi:hypothetical protein